MTTVRCREAIYLSWPASVSVPCSNFFTSRPMRTLGVQSWSMDGDTGRGRYDT